MPPKTDAPNYQTQAQKDAIEATKPVPKFITELAGMVNMDPAGYKKITRDLAKASAGRDLTDEEYFYFMSIAAKYKLNPLGKGEIYAFAKKGGGIQVVVGVDGWIKICQNSPDWEGMDAPVYIGERDDLTCSVAIYRKSFPRPFVVPVTYGEFKMPNNLNWSARPRWMLYIRAFCMTTRFAFGLGDIIDSDEAERWIELGLLNGAAKAKEALSVASQQPNNAPAPAATVDAPKRESAGSKVNTSPKQQRFLCGKWHETTKELGVELSHEELDQWLTIKNSGEPLSYLDMTTKHVNSMIDKWDTYKPEIEQFMLDKGYLEPVSLELPPTEPEPMTKERLDLIAAITSYTAEQIEEAKSKLGTSVSLEFLDNADMKSLIKILSEEG